MPNPEPSDPNIVVLGVDPSEDQHVAVVLSALGGLLAYHRVSVTGSLDVAVDVPAPLWWSKAHGVIRSSDHSDPGSADVTARLPVRILD